MRERLLKNKKPAKRLQQLLVLMALLLVPLGAWGQTSYNVWINEVQLTSENVSTMLDGSIAFAEASGEAPATLTLKGTTAITSISTSLSNLKIHVEGPNSITTGDGANGATKNAIYSSKNDGKLTFSVASEGSLEIISTAAAILGFQNIEGHPATNTPFENKLKSHPNGSDMYRLCEAEGDSVSITWMKVSEATTYPLWIGTTQVTSANQSNIIQDNTGPNYNKVAYEAGTLTLSGAELSGLYHRIATNSTEDLTIELNGANSIESDLSPIMAVFSTAPATSPKLIFKGSGYITLNPGIYYPAISGFDVDLTTNGMCTDKDFNTAEQTVTVAKEIDLKIKNIQVTSANASDVLESEAAAPPVKFDYENNTLTLNGAAIDGTIVSGLGNLTIAFQGTNSLTGTSGYISSTENTASLTLKGGTGTSTLSLTNTTGYSAVEGFASVTLDGAYLKADNICKYNGEDRAYKFSDGIKVQSLQFTTTLYYPLWVGSQQVYDGNKNDIFNDVANPITASFTPSSNTLTLNGVSIDSSNGIESGLNSLIIDLKGNNSINTNTAAHYNPIYSIDETATLTIQKATDATNCELILSSSSGVPQMVKGFSSVNLTGLNFVSKTGSKIDDAATTDATLSSATLYPLWIGGELVSEGHTSFDGTEGTITYSESGSEKTLTFEGYQGAFGTGNAIETGIEGLKVKLNGSSTITCEDDDAFAFKGVQENASIQFVKGENGKLTMTTAGTTSPFNGFSDGKVTYDGLGCYESGDNEWTIEALPATPTIAHDDTKTYLDTDKIEITGPENTTIFYTWDEAVIGTEYTHNADKPTLTIYTAPGVAAQTGTHTLRAWAGKTIGDNKYLMSEAASQAFTVKTDIENLIIEDISVSQSYTGSKVEPTFTLKDGGKPLTKNTDYTVAYYAVVNGDQGDTPVDMIEVGEYRIVISGKGNYGGIKTQDFEITKANLNIVTIEAIADQTYTGSKIEPEIKVTLNDVTLTPDDYGYEISYSNNTNVPASGAISGPTVTLTALATSKYFTEGTTKTAPFNIVPKSIQDVTVTLSGDGFDTEKNCFVYNGQNQKPTVTVKDGEKLLVLDTDYTLENNGGVGAEDNYDVTVRGKGNYDENTSFVVTYGIAPRSIAETNVNLDATATYVYTGWEQKPEPVVKYGDTQLVKDEDYTLSYSNNINAAAEDSGDNAPTITITGMGNFDENTTTTVKFTINKADLAGAAISKISFGGKDYTVGDADIEIEYTGEAIHPTVEEVTYNDGTVTLDASEYTVSWGEHNTELSNESESAQVIITATGKNFTAGNSTSLNFKIVAANVKITAPNQTETYNGSPQAYTSATVNNENATLAIAYYAREEDRSKGSNALAEAPTNADTYYVRVTQTNSNYTAEPADATFTIDQLSIADAVITLDKTELTYNETEQTVNVTKVMVGTVEVPATSYEVSDNVQTLAGEHTVTVTAKPNEGTFKNNFKGFATTTFTIKDRTAEISFGSGLTYMTYYHADENFLIPDGVSAYIITGVEGNTLTIKKVSYLKAGVPLLLAKTAGSTSTKDPEEDFTVNLLKYASSDVNTTGNEFVLYKNEFVKATGTISQKCYLNLASVDPAHTRSFSIGDGTTGMVNGQWSMVNDQWYDLQGRKIQKPTKAGLYIQNGKVIMINNK